MKENNKYKVKTRLENALSSGRKVKLPKGLTREEKELSYLTISLE